MHSEKGVHVMMGGSLFDVVANVLNYDMIQASSNSSCAITFSYSRQVWTSSYGLNSITSAL